MDEVEKGLLQEQGLLGSFSERVQRALSQVTVRFA
jgi:hypothetical protein